CLLIGATMVYVIPDIVTAFTLVTTLAAVLFMFIWSLIVCSYIAYRRRHAGQHASSIYKMPGGVVMCVACLVFFAFVVVLLTLRPDTLKALLAAPVWFALLGIGYAWKRFRSGAGPGSLAIG